jgi:hypothetical protein
MLRHRPPYRSACSFEAPFDIFKPSSSLAFAIKHSSSFGRPAGEDTGGHWSKSHQRPIACRAGP